MAESLRKQAIRQLRIPTLDKEISSVGKKLSHHDFLVFIKGAVNTFSISNEGYSGPRRPNSSESAVITDQSQCAPRTVKPVLD